MGWKLRLLLQFVVDEVPEADDVRLEAVEKDKVEVETLQVVLVDVEVVLGGDAVALEDDDDAEQVVMQLLVADEMVHRKLLSAQPIFRPVFCPH